MTQASEILSYAPREKTWYERHRRRMQRIGIMLMTALGIYWVARRGVAAYQENARLQELQQRCLAVSAPPEMLIYAESNNEIDISTFGNFAGGYGVEFSESRYPMSATSLRFSYEQRSTPWREFFYQSALYVDMELPDYREHAPNLPVFVGRMKTKAGREFIVAVDGKASVDRAMAVERSWGDIVHEFGVNIYHEGSLIRQPTHIQRSFFTLWSGNYPGTNFVEHNTPAVRALKASNRRTREFRIFGGSRDQGRMDQVSINYWIEGIAGKLTVTIGDSPEIVTAELE